MIITKMTVNEGVNVAKQLGLRSSNNMGGYLIDVVSQKNGEKLYSVLMEPDGTIDHRNMFIGAWNGGKFDFEYFDNYFPKIKKTDVKIDTALFRLKEPYQLSDSAEKQYLSYARRNATSIVKQFIETDAKEFELCSNRGLIKKNNVEELIEYANLKKNTEWTAFLLDCRNNIGGAKIRNDEPKVTPHLIGDVIVLGQYIHADKDDPIEWIIVGETKKQYLVTSKYYIHELPFYTGPTLEDKYVGWSDSDIRKWLNTVFFEKAFTDSERTRICKKKIKTSGDIDTEDYLFLPSVKEHTKYISAENIVDKIGTRYYKSWTALDTEVLRTVQVAYRKEHPVVMEFIADPSQGNGFRWLKGDIDDNNFIRPMMWITKE